MFRHNREIFPIGDEFCRAYRLCCTVYACLALLNRSEYLFKLGLCPSHIFKPGDKSSLTEVEDP